MEYVFRKLSVPEILDYFKQIKNDFPSYCDAEYCLRHAEKLSRYANFVTCITDGRMVGMIAYYMNCQPLCYITHVSVIDGFKRRGITSRMLELLTECAKERGFSCMKLEVAINNMAAISCYTHNGFEQKGRSDSGFYMEKTVK